MRKTTSPAAYSLPALLARQPASLRKRPEFARLEAMLRESPALARVRLSRTAFRLLDEPRLELRHLETFRSTYRLPDSPFFRVFLEAKWGRGKTLAERRASIRGRVDGIMESYPSYARGMMAYLAGLEKKCSGKTRQWDKGLRPRTLKRARELAGLTLAQWTALFRAHIRSLRGAYRTIAVPPESVLLASMILECLPDPRTGKARTKAEIKASFRIVSKACHPDMGGGDPARFRLLVKARDVLLE